MNILSELTDRFRSALAGWVDDPSDLLDMVRLAQNPSFGDYQANLAMPLAKQLGRPSREVAQEIVARLPVGDMCAEVSVAGPGFINLRLDDVWLVKCLEAARRDDRLGVRRVADPRTFVVDFSSPNVAKPLHVGHIRSTVIGDAICRLLRFVGHRVISDNHLGDWGTQFGMIIYGFRHFADRDAYRSNPVEELSRLYRVVRQLVDAQQTYRQEPELQRRVELLASEAAELERHAAAGGLEQQKRQRKTLAKVKADLASARSELADCRERMRALEADAQLSWYLREHPDVEGAVLQETARLHDGAKESLHLWRDFLPHCLEDIRRIYRRLGVTFDYELGESFYQERLERVVEDLKAAGLATESDGACCVFLEGFDTPMLVRKKDGAFLYATSDLATIQYRMERWHPDTILYVVDSRQQEHFAKLFSAARRWGYDNVALVHISFGTVLGEDGKPFRTRAGETVRLEGLLDEAERRAEAIVRESDDALPPAERLAWEERRRIARVVGIAALKYADLSQNRTSDYVFSYDKMLALNGNTATYMQYSYARVHGIFKRGEVDADALRNSTALIRLDHPAERALGFQLLRFSESIDEALADYRPNLLTSYLYDLARCYSTFFEECPVLRAETEEQRDSRLLLCDLTARTLKQGLAVLGIEVIERM
jgi:arginyl-tRNA synthetase